MIRYSVTAESLISSAEAFATAAHAAVGQQRKYTSEPYIVHPRAVVEIIRRPYISASWEMVCAAWLHDVVEDTQVASETIHHMFGNGVGYLVDALTNVPASAGNRKARHSMNIERLKAAPPGAQTIKIADIIDNTWSITRRDPNFAEIYLEEKAAVLAALTDANPQLRNLALDQIWLERKELFYA